MTKMLNNLNETELAIYNRIIVERDSQKANHSHDHLHPLSVWAAILAKQLGQASEQVIRDDIDVPRLEKQLVQIAAVAVAWLEILELVRLPR